jgi:hypothetical protein
LLFVYFITIHELLVLPPWTDECFDEDHSRATPRGVKGSKTIRAFASFTWHKSRSQLIMFSAKIPSKRQFFHFISLIF